MEIPFRAYRGDEPYAFVCYAHKDADVVYPEISRLHDSGVNISYDDGISPGELFTDELAELIEGAAVFLFFVTPRSVASRHCLNEVQYATARDKRVVAVHLEETELPKGLELSIGLAQAIMKYRLQPHDYEQRLRGALSLEASTAPPAPEIPQSGRSSRTTMITAGAVMALAAAGWVYFEYFSNGSSTPDTTSTSEPAERVTAVAVLPFSNVGDDPEQAYFSDGLTVDIIANLQKLRLFPVIAHSSTFIYRDRTASVREVGAALGAAYVVEGTIRRSGDRLRVTAQLQDATNGYTVWSQTYERQFADVFALQDEITRSIAASVAPEIHRSEIERVRSKPTDNLTAYDLYLKGTRLAPRGPVQDMRAAREYLLEATRLDPDFAHPWARLARIEHDFITYYGPDSALASLEDHRRRALEYADRAIQLDPLLADGHTWRGHMLLHYQRVDEALEAYARALALNPSSADAVAQYAWGKIISGRYQEGIELIQQARRLNPNDPMAFEHLTNEAWAYAWMGDEERAIEIMLEATALNPDNLYAYVFLASAYREKGDEAQALRMIEILRDRFPGFNTRAMEYSSLRPEHYERWSEDLLALGWVNPE
jgi:TolB-like protein